MHGEGYPDFDSFYSGDSGGLSDEELKEECAAKGCKEPDDLDG